MTSIVQIYTLQDPDEARDLVRIGVDRVGVTPAQRGLPGEVTVDRAVAIVDAVRGSVVTSALTVETDPDAIVAMAEAVRPDVLHLSGPTRGLTTEDVARIRASLPGVEIMVAVAVEDGSAVDDALEYAAVADTILLDSVTPDVEGIGAAGVVHDWSISRRIVESVDVPVVLAGGLGAHNVAAAIRAVHPWAVDSLTHTNRPLPGGGFRKDLGAVAAFVAAARGAS
jgi:phosphoribosylanthranilate isomerase